MTLLRLLIFVLLNIGTLDLLCYHTPYLYGKWALLALTYVRPRPLGGMKHDVLAAFSRAITIDSHVSAEQSVWRMLPIVTCFPAMLPIRPRVITTISRNRTSAIAQSARRTFTTTPMRQDPFRPAARVAGQKQDVWSIVNEAAQASPIQPIVNMGQGFFGYNPPEFVLEAAKEALGKVECNQYSPTKVCCALWRGSGEGGGEGWAMEGRDWGSMNGTLTEDSRAALD